jgi:hypothetical protein
VWRYGGRLPVKVSARWAGLNPEFHFEQLELRSAVVGTQSAFENHVDAPLAFAYPASRAASSLRKVATSSWKRMLCPAR